MFRNPSVRSAVRACVAALFALALGAAARADLLFLKDGFVVQGKVKRDYKFVVEGGEGIDIPVGPFYLDDGPRRIAFSPRQIRIVEKRAPGVEERLNNARVLLQPPRPLPALLEVLSAGPFDAKWERTFRFRMPTKAVSISQHLGFITPYWARVDAMESFAWSACYLTNEFTADELLGVLSTHPDLVEKPGMPQKEIVNRRIRLARFLRQAGHFGTAERELQALLKDYPAEAPLVNAEIGGLNLVRSRERYEDLKHMHVAAQYKAARDMMDNLKDAPPLVLADVNDLKAEYDATAKKIVEARRLLESLSKESFDGKTGPVATEAAAAIAAELQPDTLSRLDAFVGQAKQFERQKAAGKSPEIAPAELVSLAATGWLLGGASAETKPSSAVRLWHARQMMIAYLKTEDAGKRADLVSAFHREHSDQRIDELLQIVPTLPPPEAETNLDTVNAIEQQVGLKGGPTYVVQLPPEYRHTRSYPVLVVLHEANEKAVNMLRRWNTAAAENGYILVAPSWQVGAAGYTYSEREHAVVLGALRDLRRKYNIDSDRVFLFGMGQGGAMAFDVGLSHPDQFAGVSTMGAYPELFAEKYFRNAQYLPFYVVSGNPSFPVPASDATSKKLKATFDEWNTRGYPALWIEYKGRGVEWFGGEMANLMDWMRTKRRAFPLHKLGTDGLGGRFGNEFTTMRMTDNQFYWLSTTAIKPDRLNSARGWKEGVTPAMLHARIDPDSNTITLLPTGIKQATVWLGRNSRGESMIDFDKPVTIRVGNEIKWAHKPIAPSLSTLMEDLYQRGDRQRPYLARVDLSW